MWLPVKYYSLRNKRLPGQYVLATFFFTCLYTKNISAQTTIVKDSPAIAGTTVVIPGKQYVRSGYHNFFWGSHYRKEWGTAIRVNNFYLDTALGGLQPLKASGSRQSMGLRLKSKSGKEYVLRSVDKDFGHGMPEMYYGTFISRIAKDQASFGYPLAALTITPMIEATGIYHTNPKLVFVPKQNALGEFSDKYGDQLYIFEERPDDDQHDVAWFGNSEKVIGTEKLYEKIFTDNDNSVDQKAFAKARLFDMFIGDWGRHADQWRWASFKEGGKTIYKPIPRDRDQSYTKFDGFYPFIATNIAGGTHLESFKDDIQKISFFNKPGRPLDMQFTNNLTEADWVNEAVELQQALTDAVIENGMQQLPPQLYAINGEKITRYLKSRRDHLQDFAHRYYKYLARKIPVYGTDDKEFFDINRINNNETVIKIYKIKKDGSLAAAPFYNRTIFNNETKDVHVYGFKDDDIFKLSGTANDGVKIRLIGITKSDSIVYASGTKGNKTKIYRGESELYDTAFHKKTNFSPVVLVSNLVYRVFEEDALALFTKPGVHVGLNFKFHPVPWRRDSLEITHNIAVNYGLLRKTFYVEYVSVFPELAGKWDLLLKGKMDNPAAENYFGIGNDTKDSSGVPANYYNVFSKRYYGGIALSRNINDRHHIDMTLFYQSVKINTNAGNYIQQKESALPVFITNNYAGIESGYRYQNTDSKVIPTKGVNFSAGAGYVVNTAGSNPSFFKAMSSFAFYIPLGKIVSIGVRTGGSTVNGEANYYHLSKLGGNVNLRGFSRERFYGKQSFYNNNEIRFITNTHNFFFTGKVGVLGFIDNGRVWQPGESSTTWHTGYGGGIIIAPFNKVALTATYGKSKDGTQLLLKAGMFF
jgi:hypothetical protein